MENTSGIHPQGVAVLIKMHDEFNQQKGMIVIPDIIKDKLAAVDQYATVLEVGPAAWHDEPAPRAKVGDVVAVTKYAGMLMRGPKDKQLYRMVNDRDIFCTVEV